MLKLEMNGAKNLITVFIDCFFINKKCCYLVGLKLLLDQIDIVPYLRLIGERVARRGQPLDHSLEIGQVAVEHGRRARRWRRGHRQ